MDKELESFLIVEMVLDDLEDGCSVRLSSISSQTVLIEPEF